MKGSINRSNIHLKTILQGKNRGASLLKEKNCCKSSGIRENTWGKKKRQFQTEGTPSPLLGKSYVMQKLT